MKKNNNDGHKIRTSLEFKTHKEVKGKKKFTFGLFILIGIVMLACVCTLLLLKEYDFDVDNIIGRTTEATQTSTETSPVNVEGKATFLVAVSNDNSTKLHHVALVSVDASTGDIKIYTVDVKEKHTGEKINGDLASLFLKSDGSMLSLKEAVSEITGAEISRYIHATDSSFKTLVKTFGGIPYDVEEQVRYSCDGVGYIIEKGTQTLTADMSYKYMYYLSQEHTNKPNEMSRFLSAIIKTIFSPENFEKADSYYNKLCNILDTDISAYDYSSKKAAVAQTVSMFEKKEAVIVGSPDQL